ncbi:stigma-specific STIG1-like protein 1 [Primulina eburnea]|uniref:stigma-specific STIG1-like protein 1 n=1 Tax=Primulina eburnea TaxID=1245227 RepID=UPI003C6C1C21
MKVIIKVISSLAAITMAVTLILTTTRNSDISRRQQPTHPSGLDFLEREPDVSTKRVSRFLEQKGLPKLRAADQCKKDKEKCDLISGNGRNATCCNNKCIDLWYDKNNCGACKKKCDFTDECCRGECVNLAFDKRHCGFCHNRCKMTPGYCIFGICDYA